MDNNMFSDIVVKKDILKLNPNDYFSQYLNDLINYNCDYYMIWGERSNGKTFALLKYCMEKYIETGKKFAYVRRWGDDLRGKNGRNLFLEFSKLGMIEKITNGKWTDVYYYSKEWYFCKYSTTKTGGEKRILDSSPFAYAYAINEDEHQKGSTISDINTIIFDEFLARRTYLNNEFISFMNVISTIIRRRDNVKVFMLGNTISMYCPYFDEMGINNIRKMEPGEVNIYDYGENDLKLLTFYVPPSSTDKYKKKSDKYFAFNNPKLNMIKSGAWEIGIYPHISWKIKDSNIIFRCFCKFYDDILELDFCCHDNKDYCFCHKKTTPIKNENSDIVCITDADPRPNWRTGFGHDKIGKFIKSYFNNNKVFYENNTIGEIMANFISETNNKKS